MSEIVQATPEVTGADFQESATKLVEEYQNLQRAVTELTLNMSARQLGRVFRSAMRFPLEPPQQMQSINEKTLFQMSIRIQDIKMMLAKEMLSDYGPPAPKTETKEEVKENV